MMVKTLIITVSKAGPGLRSIMAEYVISNYLIGPTIKGSSTFFGVEFNVFRDIFAPKQIFESRIYHPSCE